jgi:hypothetical protein
MRLPRPLFLVLSLLLAGCTGQQAPAPAPAPAQSPAAAIPYKPAFVSAAQAAAASPGGTVAAAFATAASAPTLGQAAEAWAAFLVRYPPDGETEDSVQKRYSDAARWELMRVYYLSGKAAEGDALLEAADPLGLR